MRLDGGVRLQPPVVDVLRDAIRHRFLIPGVLLNQHAVARALGISRIPVREALHMLAGEGLVSFTAVGVTVTSLSASEVDDVFSLRLQVEPSMAQAVVQNYGPGDLAELQRLARAMDEAGGPVDIDRWLNANHAFHDALCRASGRQHSRRIALQLSTLVEPYVRLAISHLDTRDESQLEHCEMLAALADRDAQRLECVIHQHLERARATLVSYADRSDAELMAPATSSIEAAEVFANRLHEILAG